MMNLLLSLCIMMSMFSGAAPLPAVPETANTTVVRDVCVEINGESVTLNPEFVISTAVGSEKAAARFEIRNGDDVLLPIAGEITPDSLRFSLMDSGRVYSLDSATLLEMMEMDEEGAAMMEKMGGMYMRMADVYQRIFSGEMMDPAANVEMNIQLGEALGAELEETEVEIDGVNLPGTSWSAETDLAGMMAATDTVLAASDDPVVSELYGVIMDLYAMIGEMEGVEIDSMADLAAEMPATPVSLEYCSAMDGDVIYTQTVTDVRDEEAGMACCVDVEQTMRGNSADYSMGMTIASTDTGEVMDMTFTGDMTWDGMTVLSTDTDFSAGFSTEETAADGTVESETLFAMDGNLVYNNVDGEKTGLMDMNASFAVPAPEIYYAEGEGTDAPAAAETAEAEVEEGEVFLQVSWDEVPTDAGAEGSVMMSMQATAEEETISGGYSFDYEKKQTPASELIPGEQVVALTPNMDGEGNAMLPIDFMGVIADGTTLTAEESMMEMSKLMDSTAADMGVGLIGGADEVADDYTYDGEYEYSERSQEELKIVGSVEEAAAIYDGEIPAYTAPEGYILDYVEVSPTYYDAYYINGEGKTINLYGYGNGADVEDDTTFLLQEDGSLTPVEQPLVNIYSYDGLVSTASATIGGEVVYFYFDYDTDEATARAAIAGLVK